MTNNAKVAQVLPSIVVKSAAAGAAVVAMTPAAFAGSSNMPWDTPMQNILNDATGPVAKTIGVLIIMGLGFAMANTEQGGMMRKVLGVVLGISIAFAAAQWGLTFFGFAGGAAL